MNTSKHMKIAGMLQILQSIPSFVFSTYYIVGIITAYRNGSVAWDEITEVILTTLLLVLLFLLGIVLIWFGYSLTRQKRWASRAGGFICCLPGLISFPFVISIYTLWVLVQANKEEKP